MSKPMKAVSKSYAFVGLYRDGTPGWMAPEFLQGSRRYPARSYKLEKMAAEYPEAYGDEPLVLVEVTLRVVKDKRGRPIMRRPKRAT